ncbi:hypothetical protein [Bradyrhizobium canariense]|nr:hypothetical protein [Bradyrhizobium canariense]
MLMRYFEHIGTAPLDKPLAKINLRLFAGGISNHPVARASAASSWR